MKKYKNENERLQLVDILFSLSKCLEYICIIEYGLMVEIALV